MALLSMPCRLLIGLCALLETTTATMTTTLAAASGRWEMLTVDGQPGLCSGAKLCGTRGVANESAICQNTHSSGDLDHSSHYCGRDEACIQALCQSDALCGGYSRTPDGSIYGSIYWLMPAGVWMTSPNTNYQCWKWTEVETTTVTTTYTVRTTTQARPQEVHPGDAVEVKCESESRYHVAAVHNVSSAGIVVLYELMGHLYYCKPKVWRTVAAHDEEACRPHGGILPAWGGNKCCPSSCGECGTTDCHARPGGAHSCCTRRIPDHHVCGRDGRGAPCTLAPALPFPFPQVRRLRGAYSAR